MRDHCYWCGRRPKPGEDMLARGPELCPVCQAERRARHRRWSAAEPTGARVCDPPPQKPKRADVRTFETEITTRERHSFFGTRLDIGFRNAQQAGYERDMGDKPPNY